MFREGQKVVCIDDSAGLVSGVIALVKGRTYTVQAAYSRSGEVLVDDGTYKAWNASRFRAERGTDISIFTKMLAEQECALTIGMRD